jgi:hypothetical protein
MTIAKDFASKAAFAFVAAAMIFTSFAPAVQAETSEDLQAKITALLAQIEALKGTGSTGSTASAAGVCPFTWTRDLKTGATGADVKALQQFLNANADTRVAATGAGSTGMETETYGPATAAAVSKFQVMYRADVLTPAGLTNPTGYFGPGTRAKANALCVTSSTTTDDEDADDEEGSDELSGEASLDEYTADDADDDTIEEGSDEAEVAVFTVNFADGDASISRLDVAFTKGTGDAWDAFDTVSLWVDGDMVAEADASSKSDYLGDEDNGIIRFSGLDIVAREDEDLEITVAASVQDNLDSAELGTWTVTTESLRFFDADGVATTDENLVDDESASFTIELAGADDEIIVRENDDNADAMTLELLDDSKSEWYNIFTFDIDTDDSTNDITLDDVDLTLTFANSSTTVAGGYDGLVSDIELVIDGVTIDDVSVLSGSTSGNNAVVLNFNVDGDVTIDAGERVAAELMVRFKSLNVANEGATVVASVAGSDIDGEGADDLSGTGSDTGEIMTLRTSGLSLEQTNTTSDVVNNDTTVDNTYGKFTSTIEVTTIGDNDLYVGNTAVRGASSTAAVAYAIVDDAGAIVTTGTSSASFDRVSGGSVSGNYTKIAGKGGTATFKVNVTSYNPAVSGNYKLQILSIGFAESATTATDSQEATPAYDFDTTSSEFIQS